MNCTVMHGSMNIKNECAILTVSLSVGQQQTGAHLTVRTDTHRSL
jgi:hypothetical protein